MSKACLEGPDLYQKLQKIQRDYPRLRELPGAGRCLADLIEVLQVEAINQRIKENR
jgi:hypothetical protein